MATLKEISQNPDLATKEDLEALKNISDQTNKHRPFFEEIAKLDLKQCAPKERHVEVMFWEHLIKNAILDTLSEEETVSTSEFLQSLIIRLPNEFSNNVTLNSVVYYFEVLHKLELVEKVNTENSELVSFKITTQGMDVVKNQTYKTLAMSAFFNRETYRLNKTMSNTNKLMLIISILMFSISVVALIATICK